MKLLTRPTERIKDDFGSDVTLVYGDIVDDHIVLYSLKPLQGYEFEKGVYSKKIPISDIESNDPVKRHLTDARGYHIPRIETRRARENGDSKKQFVLSKDNVTEPSEFERALLGVNGSYAYVGSTETVKLLDPEQHKYEQQVRGGFVLRCPSDIILRHEGTHVAMHPHFGDIFPDYMKLVSIDGPEEDRNGVLDEAVSFLSDLRHIREFHPDLEGQYHDWRRDGFNPSYVDAHRIVSEHPNEVAEIITRVKERNSNRFL